MEPQRTNKTSNPLAATRPSHMEDPFAGTVKEAFSSLPSMGSGWSKTAESFPNINQNIPTRPAAGLFNNDPVHHQSSSAVQLPSSPTSQGPRVSEQSPTGLSASLRASGSNLRPGAATFTPQFNPPKGPRYYGGSQNNPSTKTHIESGKAVLEDVRGSSRGTQALTCDREREAYLCTQKSPMFMHEGVWPHSPSNHSPSPSLSRRGGYSTPRIAQQPTSQALVKRRLAYSDEPSLHSRSTAFNGPASPSRISKHNSLGGRLEKRSFREFQYDSTLAQIAWQARLLESPTRRLFSDPVSFNANGANAMIPNLPNGKMLSYNGQGSFQRDLNSDPAHSTAFDQYASTTTIPPQNHSTPQAQLNPYSQEPSAISSGAYYPGGANYPQQQLQHHLYAALPPQRELGQPNQRTIRDLFIPENLRQTLSRKSEASLMTIPNSTLPPAVAHYHSLVPLVHNVQKNNKLFGYTSHAYKATSGQDGNFYCLRRLQGERE
ncbi:MAG: hypothetical protein Q9222_006006 [Ikaeria aurantiellina]